MNSFIGIAVIGALLVAAAWAGSQNKHPLEAKRFSAVVDYVYDGDTLRLTGHDKR